MTDDDVRALERAVDELDAAVARSGRPEDHGPAAGEVVRLVLELAPTAENRLERHALGHSLLAALMALVPYARALKGGDAARSTPVGT
jgi:hypothetical protein